MIEIVGGVIAQLRREWLVGPVGPAGPSGPRGEQGLPGKLPMVKLWVPETVYYAGDVVAHDGRAFQARRDTGQPPTFAKDWILLAVAGHDGKSLRPRGSFDADGEYRALDVVLCNGSSYVALATIPANVRATNGS